ncbi:hypothetical protein ABK040_014748 [Willaertia magna]
MSSSSTPRTPVISRSASRQSVFSDSSVPTTPLNEITKDKERERTKALLASFYGNMANDEENAENSQVFDTTDIDSHHFSSDNYLKKYIKDKTVDQLMQQEDLFRKQIKKIDTSLQELVYKNYNKFITATDTIKKMKQHVEGMEDEMERLSKNMEQITTSSETVNSNLQSKRDKIERLSNVNRMLKKMQFLLELPTKLNECIKMRKYSVAVKYYTIASAIFRKNAHLSGFKNIEQESTDVMNKMKETIASEVKEIDKVNEADLRDNLKILIDLGEPIEKIRDLFLDIRYDYLNKNMENVLKSLQKDNLSNKVKGLNESLLPKLLSFYDTFAIVFLMGDSKVKMSADQLTKDFVDWTKKVLTIYFDNIRLLLLQKDNIVKNDLKEALTYFCNETISTLHQIPNTLSKLQDKVYNLIGDSVKTYLICEIERIKKITEENISKLAETSDNTQPSLLTKLVEDTIIKLKSDLSEAMINFSDFITPGSSGTPFTWVMQFKDVMFKNWMKSMCVDFVDSTLQFCKQFSIPHSKVAIFKSEEFKQKKVTAIGSLLLSKLCTQLPLQEIKTMLMEKFPTTNTNNENKKSKNRFDEQQYDDSLFNIENIEIRIRECSTHLIVYYIEVQGKNVSKLIRTGMETHNWLDTDVPRDVRHVVRVIVNDLCNIKAQLVEVFPPSHLHDIANESSDSTKSSVKSSVDVSSSALTYGGSDSLKYGNNSELVKDVLRIFNKRLSSFTIKTPRFFGRISDAPFSSNELLTEILKVSIKTLEECVRGVTFGKNGFQQLQVDIAYLQQKCYSLIDDRNYVPLLAQEVMVSVSERCTEALPLESTIIQSIVNKYASSDDLSELSEKSL